MRWITPMVAALAVCAPLSAAERSAEADALLVKISDTMKGVQSLSYEGEWSPTGPAADKMAPMKAKVVAKRIDGGDRFNPWAYRMTGAGGSAGADATFDVSFDGKVYRSAKADGKVVHEVKVESPEDMVYAESMQMLGALSVDQMLAENPMAKVLETKVAANEKIEGVDCVVVSMTQQFEMDPSMMEEGEKAEPQQMTFTVYAGAEDHLPRKITYAFGGAEAWGMNWLLKDVVVNPELSEGSFLVPVPAGWELKNVTADELMGRPPQPDPIAVGVEAPDATFYDVDGKAHKISDYRGKVVVLDFWATWCGPCKRAMPSVQKLHERFAGKPVEVIGMNCWENEDADPAAYMKSKNYTYTLMLKGDEAATAYGVSGIPTFYIIGTDGKVLFHEVGFDPEGEERIAKVIEEHLKAAGM